MESEFEKALFHMNNVTSLCYVASSSEKETLHFSLEDYSISPLILHHGRKYIHPSLCREIPALYFDLCGHLLQIHTNE